MTHGVSQSPFFDMITRSQSETMRLYSYIVRFDDGFAPCAMDGLCSLACCKPKIRKNAQRGHWVMGTTPKKHGAGKLVYMMQVGRVLSFADYYRNLQLRRRRDCIYRRVGGRYEQIENPWHGHANRKKDLSGKHVLLSRRFVYFGKNAPDMPERYWPHVASTQGHRVWGTPGTKAPNRIRPNAIRSLARWAFSKGRGVRGKPADSKAAKHTGCEH